jgi:hypothetical protein
MGGDIPDEGITASYATLEDANGSGGSDRHFHVGCRRRHSDQLVGMSKAHLQQGGRVWGVGISVEHHGDPAQSARGGANIT